MGILGLVAYLGGWSDVTCGLSGEGKIEMFMSLTISISYGFRNKSSYLTSLLYRAENTKSHTNTLKVLFSGLSVYSCFSTAY